MARRKSTRKDRREERAMISEEIMKFMEERPGFYGENGQDAIDFLKKRLSLTCSNSRVRESLNNLINKGLIKRKCFNLQAGTPDAAHGEDGVIFYKDGVPDDRFPPAFLAFVDKNRSYFLTV